MPSARRAIAFLALLAQALASVTFTNSNMQMYSDTPFTLTWTGDQQGAVTIRLMTGTSDNLNAVTTLTTSGEGGSFTWTPPSTIASGTYAFEISDESGDEPNYSSPFSYNKDAVAPVTTSGDSSSTSASASGSQTTSSLVTATMSGNSTITTTTTSSGASESTDTNVSSTSSKGSSSKTTSSSESTGTVTNLNGNNGAGARSGVPTLAVLVSLVGAGLFAFA